MEMRGKEDIEIGEDITPAIPALCFSLNDSSLSTHCSSCFSPIAPSSSPQNPLRLLYCSPPSPCFLSSSSSSSDADLLLLLHSRPSLYPHGDSTDLRLALRLLSSSSSSSPLSGSDRIAGLLTNRSKLMAPYDRDNDVVARIRDGARAMAAARRMRNDGDAVLEEAALCLVITNAVEVHDKSGHTLGLAVFDTSFCWINHSCSPNAFYRTLLSADYLSATSSSSVQTNQPLRIVPYSCSGCEYNQAVRNSPFP